MLHALYVIATGVITAKPTNSSSNLSSLPVKAPIPPNAGGYSSYAPHISTVSLLLIAIVIILVIGLALYWRRIKRRV